MVLERLRRFGRRESGKLSCFGKLPLYGEFLRYRLDGREADWVVNWLDAAHHLISRAQPVTSHDRELRAIVTLGAERKVAAALIRPSTDAKARSYPICVFSLREARPLRDCWHLAPMWLNPVWGTIRSVVLDPSISELEAFEDALESVTFNEEDVAASAERFREATDTPMEHPWQVLTGTSSADSAAAIGATFAQVADYQSAARPDQGLAISLPAAIAPALQGDALGGAALAVWMRLFSAFSGRVAAWPCAMELRENGAPIRYFLFGREPAPPDLAHALAGVGDSTFESLNEPWEDAPSSEKSEEITARLLAPNSGCIRNLWES